MEDIRFKIAEAARMAGVSPSTLRLWETQDLIQPIRTPSGQRLYDRALVERLKTIAWLRSEKGLNPAAIRESLREEVSADDVNTSEHPDEEGPGAAEIPIGLKVRRLRRDAGKTLETIAQATGVSTSQLSTFERTSQGLSFTALHGVGKIFSARRVASLSWSGRRGRAVNP